MAARLINIITKPEKLRKDKADRLHAALRELEAEMDLPFDLMRTIHREIAKKTPNSTRWAFVMVSPEQNKLVVSYLSKNSKRPLLAVNLWATCFEHLHYDTGEILLTRDELADIMHEQPRTISTIMSELEKFGAIIKQKQKIGGMKGHGIVRYFMHPRIATHVTDRARDEAQAVAPKLTLVKS
jgi:hypothetical protein